MNRDLTAEELKEVIRAARVFSPGFGESELQGIAELQRRLKDSGYLETVRAVSRLESERGIPLSQALETYDHLVLENVELEKKVAAHRASLERFEGILREAGERHRQLAEANERAVSELKELRRQHERDQKELEDFRKKAAVDRQHIDEELVENRRKADVTEKETATAGQLKQEVTKHGFSLELVLGLAQEFGGHDNARKKLAEELNKHGKLTSYLSGLEAEIKRHEEGRHQLEGLLSRLGAERDRQEATLLQLNVEITEKGELVSFYHRYIHLRPLMEYLGGWDQVTFHHCLWCGAIFWVLCPGKVRSSAYKCAWCGLTLVDADRNAYAALEQAPGTALKLLA